MSRNSNSMRCIRSCPSIVLPRLRAPCRCTAACQDRALWRLQGPCAALNAAAHAKPCHLVVAQCSSVRGAWKRTRVRWWVVTSILTAKSFSSKCLRCPWNLSLHSGSRPTCRSREPDTVSNIPCQAKTAALNRVKHYIIRHYIATPLYRCSQNPSYEKS